MNDRLDSYRAIQRQREDNKRKVTADRWDAVKSWLGVFGFALSIPTFGLTAANFYYNMLLRYEHLGLVLTAIPILHLDPDTKLLSTTDPFEGTFINFGNRPLAVQGIYVELSTHSPLTTWNERDCGNHDQSLKGIGGTFVIKDKDVVQQKLPLDATLGLPTEKLQQMLKEIQDYRKSMDASHLDVLTCVRVHWISPSQGNMAVSIPIQKARYDGHRLIPVASAPASRGEIDVWTHSYTIFSSQ